LLSVVPPLRHLRDKLPDVLPPGKFYKFDGLRFERFRDVLRVLAPKLIVSWDDVRAAQALGVFGVVLEA
jgi:hypothetical protein